MKGLYYFLAGGVLFIFLAFVVPIDYMLFITGGCIVVMLVMLFLRVFWKW